MLAPTHPAVWLLEVAAASFAGGVVGSISGLGGGIVIVPVLTLLLHLPVEDAIAASIISVIAVSSGAGSVYVKDRITNIRIAMFLELSTAAGALLGAAVLSRYVSPRVLLILFGLMLLLSLIPVFAHAGEELPEGVTNDALANKLRLNGIYHDRRLKRDVPYNVTGVPAALGIMAAAGIISGLLGIGAGVVKVLAHEVAMRVPTKVSTATSNFMIGVTAAAAAGVYLRRGQVLPYLTAPVAIGVLAGAFAGTVIMERMSNLWIRRVFAITLGVIGVQMLARNRGAPLTNMEQSIPEAHDESAAAASPPSVINDVSAWVLRTGVIVSASVMLLGLLVSFLHGTVSLDRVEHARFTYNVGRHRPWDPDAARAEHHRSRNLSADSDAGRARVHVDDSVCFRGEGLDLCRDYAGGPGPDHRRVAVDRVTQTLSSATLPVHAGAAGGG